MPSRIVIKEDPLDQDQDPHENYDQDVIRNPLRRLRGSRVPYWASQRASGDNLPLLTNSQCPARARLPPPPHPPSPTYQPQPHQLIAVCFNHMAGRECEHCQQLNRGLANTKRDERSPDSVDTLGSKQEQRNSRSSGEDDEEPKDGGEKGGQKGPPKPVGLWNKKLNGLRLEVFGLWARTSELHLPA